MEELINLAQFLLSSSDLLQLEQRKFLGAFDTSSVVEGKQFLSDLEKATTTLDSLNSSNSLKYLQELRRAKDNIHELTLEAESVLRKEKLCNEKQSSLIQRLEKDYQEHDFPAKKPGNRKSSKAIEDKSSKKIATNNIGDFETSDDKLREKIERLESEKRDLIEKHEKEIYYLKEKHKIEMTKLQVKLTAADAENEQLKKELNLESFLQN